MHQRICQRPGWRGGRYDLSYPPTTFYLQASETMADRDYSKFQQKVIKSYYDNREQIDEGKLSELVTNLYLAETDKKKAKLWENATKLMERLEVPATRIEHVVGTQDPAILAAVVQDLQKGVIGPGKGKKPPARS